MIKNLTARVVEHLYIKKISHDLVHTIPYKGDVKNLKVLHIEKISHDLARMLADMMNKHSDSYFTVEDENDE